MVFGFTVRCHQSWCKTPLTAGMASSDLCIVVVGPLLSRAEASDVHAVWQAWAVSLILWSSRSRDCVSVHVNRIPWLWRSHSLIEEDKNAPNTPPPPTRSRVDQVALRHRPRTNVAILSRRRRFGIQRAASRSVSNGNSSLLPRPRRDRVTWEAGMGLRMRCLRSWHRSESNLTSHITRTLLPIKQAHVISIYSESPLLFIGSFSV